MTKAKTKSLSLPGELIPKINKSANLQHKKFSEWMRDAALEKLARDAASCACESKGINR